MCIELFQLRNKVAIVTGASRGLGKSMAMALAEVGANLVLVGRDKERLEGAAREIADFGVKTLPVIADVTRAEGVETVVSRTLEEFGKIDVLVNNVGTYLGKPIVESTLEDWHNLINTNLTSTYLCSRAVGRYMVERQRGKVINMAAALGALGANNASAYCASKGGVIQFTRALAVEWARYNINVNAIAPGTMETELTKAMLEDPAVRKAVTGKIPMKRTGQPSDLAGVVIFLAWFLYTVGATRRVAPTLGMTLDITPPPGSVQRYLLGYLLASLLVAFLLYGPVVAEANQGTTGDAPWPPWPMFRHNPSHSGSSTYSGTKEGVLRWRFPVMGKVTSSPAIGADGTIYIGSEDGQLYALTPEGEKKWSFSAQKGITSSPAISPTGNIYIGSRDCNLYALRPDGTLLWSYKTGDSILSSPVIGPEGTIYIGSSDYKLYALSPEGRHLWEYDTRSPISPSPCLSPDGTIFLGTNGGLLFALGPNGGLKWSKRYGRDIYSSFSSPTAGPKGGVYIGSENGRLYGFTHGGEVVLRVQTGKAIQCSIALGPDGTLYFGSYDKNFYAVGPDGNLKWSYKTGGWIESSPALGADGSVYFGAAELDEGGQRVGNLYALSQEGQLAWSFRTEDWIESSPAIGPDGTIYFGANDHYVYAIGRPRGKN